MGHSLFKAAVRRTVATVAPFALLERMVNPGGIVSYYHMVSDEEVVHIKHLYAHKRIREFTDDLDFLLRAYKPVALAEVIDASRCGRALPKKTFHLTFDDGFREMSDIVAPILRQKGIPATFFINTAFIDNAHMCYQHKASLLEEHFQRNPLSEGTKRTVAAILQKAAPTASRPAMVAIAYGDRALLDDIGAAVGYDFTAYLTRQRPYLTSEQIRDLIRQGFTIGAHSVDHPLYRSLSLEEQLLQTMASLEELKGRFALTYGAFAFPHSDHGVSARFFERLYETGAVDVTFGTSGIVDDAWAKNRQRVNLEKPRWPARNLLRYHLIRRLYRNVVGTSTLRRN